MANSLEKLSPRKRAICDLANRMAPERDAWIARNAHYHEEDLNYLGFLVPQGLRVLVLGGDIGLVLDRLKPSHGVGVSISEKMIALARDRFPDYEYHAGDIEDPQVLGALTGTFDVIVLVDMIGLLEDCEAMLASLQRLSRSDTRVVIAYWSHLWDPILKLASALGHRMPQVEENWLSTADIDNLLNLSDFEIVKRAAPGLLISRLSSGVAATRAETAAGTRCCDKSLRRDPSSRSTVLFAKLYRCPESAKGAETDVVGERHHSLPQ